MYRCGLRSDNNECKNTIIPTVYHNPRISLFKIWLILILLIVILCVIITIYQTPLDEYDLLKYIKPNKKSIFLSQEEANCYALTHDISKLSTLTDRELLGLPPSYVPNLTDFAEDDHNFKNK